MRSLKRSCVTLWSPFICKYFGITPKEFFDDGQRAPEKLRHLMDELVQLSDAQLEAVTAVVENMRKP